MAWLRSCEYDLIPLSNSAIGGTEGSIVNTRIFC